MRLTCNVRRLGLGFTCLLDLHNLEIAIITGLRRYCNDFSLSRQGRHDEPHGEKIKIMEEQYKIAQRIVENHSLAVCLSLFPLFSSVNKHKRSPEKGMIRNRRLHVRLLTDSRLFLQIDRIAADLQNCLPPRLRRRFLR